jgi:hypothetical protein
VRAGSKGQKKKGENYPENKVKKYTKKVKKNNNKKAKRGRKKKQKKKKIPAVLLYH